LNVGVAEPGDQVVKIGRSSGVTAGVVEAILLSPMEIMLDFAEVAVFGDCFEVRGLSTPDFSLPGDSGALLIRQHDRAAVGVLTAWSAGQSGHPPVTIACPLGPALEALGVQLLRPS
jgi:hypothetical protein